MGISGKVGSLGVAKLAELKKGKKVVSRVGENDLALGYA